jgi:Flp pilus assembly protein CpaB
MRKAIIAADGTVENVILIEEDSNWQPPEGTTLIDAGPGAEPGGTYSKGKFTRVPIVIGEPTLEEKVAALESQVAALSRGTRRDAAPRITISMHV